MTNEEYELLTLKLARRQDWLCATCGETLPTGYPLEIAHRIPRGQIVRKVGKWAEWHPDAVALVCTRRGKACNDGALLPIGVARQELIDHLLSLTTAQDVIS